MRKRTGPTNSRNMEAYVRITPRKNFYPLAESLRAHTLCGDLGGTTLIPGIYKATEAVMIQAGDLTLDARGDEHAVWTFQLASDFTTVGGAGGNVILSGNAKAQNVFWQTERLASIGEGTSFKGNILAKMRDQDVDKIPVAIQPLKSRGSKINFSKQSSMGWPHYGQQL